MRCFGVAFFGTILALASACAVAAAAADQAPEPYRVAGFQLLEAGADYLELGLGVFEISDFSDGQALAANLEWRGGRKLYFLGPALGVMANTDGGLYGYAGVCADLARGRWVATPLAAAGAYEQGESKDLGGAFEFRLSLTLARQVGERCRLGIKVAHLSNAGINGSNPGEEEVYVTIAVGF